LSFSEISLTPSAGRSVGVSSGAAALLRVSRARTLVTAVTLEFWGWGIGTPPAALTKATSSRRNVAGNLSFHIGRLHCDRSTRSGFEPSDAVFRQRGGSATPVSAIRIRHIMEHPHGCPIIWAVGRGVLACAGLPGFLGFSRLARPSGRRSRARRAAAIPCAAPRSPGRRAGRSGSRAWA
jgi:hypothetical protein